MALQEDWSPKGRKKLVEVVKSQQLIETAAEREALFTLKERGGEETKPSSRFNDNQR